MNTITELAGRLSVNPTDIITASARDPYAGDLWSEASRDIEAEQRARLLAEARAETSDVWAFLAGATSREDFTNRLALSDDSIDASLGQIEAQAIRGDLVEGWRSDWSRIASVRQATRKQAASDVMMPLGLDYNCPHCDVASGEYHKDGCPAGGASRNFPIDLSRKKAASDTPFEERESYNIYLRDHPVADLLVDEGEESPYAWGYEMGTLDARNGLPPLRASDLPLGYPEGYLDGYADKQRFGSRSARKTARFDDIVAYTYKADLYTPAGVIEALIRDGKASPAARDMNPDDAINQILEANGFDPNDLYQWDSDDLPKLVFDSDLELQPGEGLNDGFDNYIYVVGSRKQAGHLDPIAYIYEADHHCVDCAFARFGRDEQGFVPETAEDSEGNPVTPLSPWDEWWDVSHGDAETLVCGTCGDEIASVDAVTASRKTAAHVELRVKVDGDLATTRDAIDVAIRDMRDRILQAPDGWWGGWSSSTPAGPYGDLVSIQVQPDFADETEAVLSQFGTVTRSGIRPEGRRTASRTASRRTASTACERCGGPVESHLVDPAWGNLQWCASCSAQIIEEQASARAESDRLNQQLLGAPDDDTYYLINQYRDQLRNGRDGLNASASRRTARTLEVDVATDLAMGGDPTYLALLDIIAEEVPTPTTVDGVTIDSPLDAMEILDRWIAYQEREWSATARSMGYSVNLNPMGPMDLSGPGFSDQESEEAWAAASDVWELLGDIPLSAVASRRQRTSRGGRRRPFVREGGHQHTASGDETTLHPAGTECSQCGATDSETRSWPGAGPTCFRCARIGLLVDPYQMGAVDVGEEAAYEEWARATLREWTDHPGSSFVREGAASEGWWDVSRGESAPEGTPCQWRSETMEKIDPADPMSGVRPVSGPPCGAPATGVNYADEGRYEQPVCSRHIDYPNGSFYR